MYAGVDIGGTKTYVAALDEYGMIVEKVKFPTPPNYQDFLLQLAEEVKQFHTQEFKRGCIGAPGKIDRTRGIGKDFGNLAWHNVPIQADVEAILHCPILVENDANLGGLSESMLLPEHKLVLYITISTGIGTGFIDNRSIAPELADSEGGHMILEYHGRRVPWESFASGRAIVHRFGKKAADIRDAATWRRIAHDLALGFIELIVIAQPDFIVVGGSVGSRFDRFKLYLLEELETYKNPLITMPTIQQAARPDDAVIYGCYDLAHHAYAPIA